MYLNLKDIYSKSWNIFAKSWWQYVLFSLIMMLILIIPFGSILQTLLALLMFNAVLLFIKNGSISFSDFFKFKEVLNTNSILLIVIIACFYALLEILGFSVLYTIFAIVYFILSIILFPLFCVVIDKQLSFKEAILYSAKLTKNIRIEILLIMIINLIIGLIGALIFLVGVFVAIPIVSIATVLVYKELEKKSSVENI